MGVNYKRVVWTTDNFGREYPKYDCEVAVEDPTPSPTPSITPTSSPTPTPSFTPTNTPTATITSTPQITPTPSLTPSITPTNTMTPTPSSTPPVSPPLQIEVVAIDPNYTSLAGIYDPLPKGCMDPLSNSYTCGGLYVCFQMGATGYCIDKNCTQSNFVIHDWTYLNQNIVCGTNNGGSHTLYGFNIPRVLASDGSFYPSPGTYYDYFGNPDIQINWL